MPMRMFWKGVFLDQQIGSTVEKHLRKLLQPEHYNNEIVLLSPEENESALQKLTPEAVETVAAGALVLDKTDNELLADKLRVFRESGASVLVIDAVDDEPYVTSATAVVKWKQKAFLMAADCLRHAYGFEQILLVTYDSGAFSGVPLPSDCFIKQKKLRCKYPAHIRLGELYRSHPERYGVIGAEALLHLYRALYNGKMQDSTIVTVAGTAVGAPCNVEVTVGTPVYALLDLCGITCEPSVLIRGGAMTGRAMTDAKETVVPSDTAFLAFAEPIRKRQYECVGCGRCSRVCPSGLMPDALYKNASVHMYEECGYLRVDKCIECGCCAYICPSNIDILDHIRRTKAALYGESPATGEEEPSADIAPETAEEDPEGIPMRFDKPLKALHLSDVFKKLKSGEPPMPFGSGTAGDTERPESSVQSDSSEKPEADGKEEV